MNVSFKGLRVPIRHNFQYTHGKPPKAKNNVFNEIKNDPRLNIHMEKGNPANFNSPHISELGRGYLAHLDSDYIIEAKASNAAPKVVENMIEMKLQRAKIKYTKFSELYIPKPVAPVKTSSKSFTRKVIEKLAKKLIKLTH